MLCTLISVCQPSWAICFLLHSALKRIAEHKKEVILGGWEKSGLLKVWPHDGAEVDELDVRYDEARALEKEGKLFAVEGSKKKDLAVGGGNVTNNHHCKGQGKGQTCSAPTG